MALTGTAGAGVCIVMRVVMRVIVIVIVPVIERVAMPMDVPLMSSLRVVVAGVCVWMCAHRVGVAIFAVAEIGLPGAAPES
ncbi:hypothetical protein NL459_28505, partial [Klebsiella pneumoniae]|nr:hypothetical protein [Klebsiella pneumoniae]